MVGTRPNFVKVAPIARELSGRPDAPPFRVVHTGQHHAPAMSAVFFDELAVPSPMVNLAVAGGPHGVQTAGILAAYERHLLSLDAPPRGVVVVGDSNSTMACALAAAKLGIPVAHVEAGLRSFDTAMPEEINRKVTDVISDLLLATEGSGLSNLAREGIPAERVRFTGNVMIDTLVQELPHATSLAPIHRGPYAYVTLHRPSNVDDPERLASLVELIEEVSEVTNVVFSVHPRTTGKLEEFALLGRLTARPRIVMSGPLTYRQSLSALAGCAVVLTDSGGLQEESSYLGVPCLTLRHNTERPVTLSLGTNVLVGGALETVVARVEAALARRDRAVTNIPGWDGRAAVRVVDALVEAWGH